MSECICEILADALLIALVYTRISRGTTRASSIIFSDKALLQLVGGELYFIFKVCEARPEQLLECGVRCYLFRHDYHFDENGDPQGSLRLQYETTSN